MNKYSGQVPTWAVDHGLAGAGIAKIAVDNRARWPADINSWLGFAGVTATDTYPDDLCWRIGVSALIGRPALCTVRDGCYGCGASMVSWAAGGIRSVRSLSAADLIFSALSVVFLQETYHADFGWIPPKL